MAESDRPPLTPERQALLLAAAADGVGRFNLGLRTREDFSDAVQDVLVRCLSFAVATPKIEEIRPYAFGVARNVQADRIKAKAAASDTSHVERICDLVRPALDEGDNSLADPHLTSVIARLIRNRLPTIHHQILNDRVCRGRTFAEIAQMLKLPPATVQRRFKEVVEIIKMELLQSAMDDPGLRETLESLGLCNSEDETTSES